MAMSVGQEGGEDAPLSDINTTPLVDVMLVLLIIFLITIPVALKVVKVQVPNLAYQPTATKAENVVLVIKGENDGTCGVYWGMARVDSNKLLELAAAKFKDEADRLGLNVTDGNMFPEVNIRTVSVHRWRCFDHAERWFHPRRLHFRTQGWRRLIALSQRPDFWRVKPCR